jgi:hypothetical protein
VLCNIQLHQEDAVLAYLNVPMDKEIYMKIPDGYLDPVNSNASVPVRKLQKGLYGLKQAG